MWTIVTVTKLRKRYKDTIYTRQITHFNSKIQKTAHKILSLYAIYEFTTFFSRQSSDSQLLASFTHHRHNTDHLQG